ncbi:MAG: FecR domain-containing protein [Steroidobacteraceae bacterium]
MKIGLSSAKPHPAVVAEASAWFIEFRAGDVNDEARLSFIDWLRRSPEHIQAYLEVSSAWAELPASDPDGRIDIGSLIARARSDVGVIELSPTGARAPHTPHPAPPPIGPLSWWPKQRRAVLATAAFALLAMVAARYWAGMDTALSYSTGIGEQRTIALADGSTVELNARSSLHVHLTDRQRNVTLIEGQALFRVSKDPRRPFVVRAGDAQVRAVGTEFDVYRRQSETVVTVVEGRVETYEDSGRAGEPAIVLSAGEQLTVLPHTPTKPTRADPSVATAWLHKRLIFEETPLSEVAEQFNRYNRRPLDIEDREIKKLKISGVYSSTDPASLISFLRNQSSIQVIETENNVRVVRREAH